MMAKGFSSVQQGVDVLGSKGDGEGGPFELLFPCELSARGFYLMFNEYQWESTGYQCLTVKVSNKEFDRQFKLMDATVKLRFCNASEITPANVLAYFAGSSPMEKNPS